MYTYIYLNEQVDEEGRKGRDGQRKGRKGRLQRKDRKTLKYAKKGKEKEGGDSKGQLKPAPAPPLPYHSCPWLS
jgi:hypothetical protein